MSIITLESNAIYDFRYYSFIPFHKSVVFNIINITSIKKIYYFCK